MPAACSMTVRRKVSATDFRDSLRDCLRAAKGEAVVLVETHRQEAKYLVDKYWLDELIRERQAILATVEVLADRELTERLLRIAQTVDDDVRAGRLKTMAEVFGDE
jgi:predicted dinucleotide-utilizing enzyme